LIGLDSADLNTSARVIRAGVTMAGTRTNRTITFPGLLLLDGTRLLTDGLELHSAVSLNKDYDTSGILAHAARVADAAGSPWGGIFRTANSAPATDGTFDGKTASAQIQGVNYSLGPVEDWSSIPEAARLRQRGNYVLVLRSEHEEKPLGLLGIRPRLAAQALVHRANIPLLESDDALSAIRAKQQEGVRVAFVSDNAGAAAGFAVCDLAIGLTDDRYDLPARADMLAPDLDAVAAIIDAAARREATVRDAVGLSALSNIVGAIWGFRGAPLIELAPRAVQITALTALADAWTRFRGGERPKSTIFNLVDPRPEMWGQRSIENVLHPSLEYF
jgi:cation-transporting P-type ATPase I